MVLEVRHGILMAPLIVFFIALNKNSKSMQLLALQRFVSLLRTTQVTTFHSGIDFIWHKMKMQHFAQVIMFHAKIVVRNTDG